MKYALVVLAFGMLASCGVDGPPVRPKPDQESGSGTMGLSVSGTANFGIVGGSAR